MNQSMHRVLLATLLVAFAFAAAAAQAGAEDAKRYIVLFENSVTRPGELARAQTEQPGRKLGFVYRGGGLRGYSAALPPGAAEALERDPRVRAVRRDHVVVPATQSTPTGIDRVFATANEELAIGDAGAPPVDADVAVIDAGVDYEHPDLDVVARTDCSNGTEKEAECSDGSGSASNHGTHVAGTVAALDNGEGVVGVAPGARIWSVKVLGTETNWESEIVAGVKWVTSHSEQIEAANMSIGCPELPCFLPTMGEAILESAKAGVVYAVAAGNNGGNANLSTFGYNEGMITVSALADFDGQPGGEAGASECREEFEEKWGEHSDDSLAAFSNWGSGVEIAAPGVCILSTEAGGGYGTMNGTSMASPHVAGAAALLAAEDKPEDLEDVEAIRETLEEEGNLEWEDTSGDGIQEPLLDLSNESVFTIDGWGIQATYSPKEAKEARLEAVSCSSPVACMAVGYHQDKESTERTLAERWNGSEWAIESTTDPAEGTRNHLRGVSCTSPTYCNAVGYYKNGSNLWRTLAMTWNGTKWTTELPPNPKKEKEEEGKTISPFLEAVDCASATACVAVGDYTTQGGGPETTEGLALHWNGEEWTLQYPESPAKATTVHIRGVSCISATACMAVGFYTTGAGDWQARAWNWNGTKWNIETIELPGEPKLSYLEGVSCVSADTCVATGYQKDSGETWRTLAANWDEGEWEEEATVDPEGAQESYLYGVSCTSSTDCTGTGKYRDAAGRTRTLAERWDGAEWAFQPTPTPAGAKTQYLPLLGVSCAYPTACEAVGYYQNSSGEFVTLAQQLVDGPPAATTEDATAVGPTEATLNATVNPLGTETTYQFEYGTTTEYGQSAPASPKAAGSGIADIEASETIDGLEGGTTYHARIVATSAEGTTYGEDVTFETALIYAFPVGEEGSGNGQLENPYDVAVDTKGNVWVADTVNDRIEEFNAEGEYLSQVGEYGSGNGQFDRPQGITIDSAGHIWVADTYNDRIQEFNAEGEYLSQFAEGGTGNGQFDRPHGVAVDSAGHIWVADTYNDRIQEFNAEGEYVSQFGESGSEDGQFNRPWAVALDSEAHLWVADRTNHRIQEFNAEGEYLSQVGEYGSGNGQFYIPSGIAVDSDDHIWVSDTGNSRLQELNTAGEFLSELGEAGSGSGQLGSPAGLTTDADDSVWVADTGNDRVTKWSSGLPPGPLAGTEAATGVKATEATLHAAIYPGGRETTYQFEYGTSAEYGQTVPASPKSVGSGLSDVDVEEAIESLEPETTYHFRVVASNSKATAYGKDLTFTTALAAPSFDFAVGEFGSEEGQFKSPYGITARSEGAVWVADTVNNRIQKFDSEGEFLLQTGSTGGGEGQFRAPVGIAANAEGSVWVADFFNLRIQSFNAEGEYQNQFSTSGAPHNLAIDPEGNLVVSTATNHIQIFNSEGELLSEFGEAGSGEGQFKSPWGVAVDGKGKIFVADLENDRIQIFNSEGEFLSEFGEAGSGEGQFEGPWGVALDGEGNIFVADSENHRVQVFDPENEYLTEFGEAGSGEGQFSYPSDVDIDSGGDIWVADRGNNRIQRWSHGP